MLPIVEKVREKLAAGRQDLRHQHDAGLSGKQVTSGLADLADTLMLDLVHEALDFSTDGNRKDIERKIAIVPHGGYGRRDLAPYSDIDLMLLYRPDALAKVEVFARRLSQNIVDVGFDLGFSTRTPSDAVSLALKDVKIYTSLLESRYLAGSVGIYSKFLSRLARHSQRRPHALIRALENARIEERQANGDTAFLLRPNIKKTRGGLRDIHLIRWLGFTKFGKSDLDELSKVSGIAESDHQVVTEAYKFLLRLRNEMHFEAGKARDVLGMNEQVRIASLWGYSADHGVLPVERLMRDYFDHTSQVVYAADHTMASAKLRFYFSDLFTPLFAHQEEGYFLVGPYRISTTKKGLKYVNGNLEGVLHLLSLANLHNKKIDHPTWQSIRSSMLSVDKLQLSSTSAWRFCTFMSDTNRLGDLLRRLHEMRVLEKIIPAFAHIRCLVQFNEYHKYTVDEHSIRAVEAATGYLQRDDILGRCYTSIKDKKVLHLALLLHDSGKGFDEDHSLVGARIAKETGEQLNLSDQETSDLVFLIKNHLMMAHLAFRRDTNDQAMVASFAADLGSTDMLKMMFVLTCADLEAVGPDTLTEWKFSLVAELYYRSLCQLSAESEKDSQEFENAEVKTLVVEKIEQLDDETQLAISRHLPADFFETWSQDEVLEIVKQLSLLSDDQITVHARKFASQSSFEYLVGKKDRPYAAVFHKITGALTSARLEILGVDICRPTQGTILYRFKVSDPEVTDTIIQQRIEQVKERISNTLSGDYSEPQFQKVWGKREGPSTEVATFPTRVLIDNNTADRATIIDVFTHDKTGLLYTITQCLHDLKLQIAAAKVGTYLDQVVDVFYVTNVDGKKIRSEQRIDKIKTTLLERINS
jgi:[protein-PII] uridylyltransferase